MAQRKNEVGKRYGMLIVKQRVEEDHKRGKYICLCDCGKEKIVRSDALISGATKSCGCLTRAKRLGPKKVYKEIITCRRCGNKFERFHGIDKKEMCSNECRLFRKKNKPSLKKCEFCLKEFNPKSKSRKFCSTKCSAQNKSRERTFVVSCKHCGKLFDRNISDVKRNKGIFCSVKCQHIGQSGRNHWAFGLNKKPTARGGKRKDLNDQYFRSSWEANIARLLDFLKIKWEYEPTTFRFKSESQTYTPDFYLPEKNTYIEIKGYMDERSAMRLKRFDEEFPTINIHILGNDEYTGIEKHLSPLIEHWEYHQTCEKNEAEARKIVYGWFDIAK